jgi:hypothetical protein
MILQNVDLGKISSASDLPWCLDGSFQAGKKKTHNWDSPVFQDHIDLQLMEFLGPGFLNWDGFTQLPTLNKTSIKKILIDKIILSYSDSNKVFYTNHLGEDHMSHILRRHEKVGVSDPSVALAHFSKLPKKVPAFLITHYIKLLCGALNYDGGRRRMFDPNASQHPNKSPLNPYPCHLCGKGSVHLPGDNARHVFSDCDIAKKAWSNIINKPHGPRDSLWASLFADRTAPLYIIDYQIADPNTGYCRLALVLTFCWAIHKTINQIRSGRDALNADSRAEALTISLSNIWRKSNKKGR